MLLCLKFIVPVGLSQIIELLCACFGRLGGVGWGEYLFVTVTVRHSLW